MVKSRQPGTCSLDVVVECCDDTICTVVVKFVLSLDCQFICRRPFWGSFTGNVAVEVRELRMKVAHLPTICMFFAGEGEVEMVRAVLVDRQAAINRQKDEAKKRRRKKKRTGSSLFASTFNGK